MPAVHWSMKGTADSHLAIKLPHGMKGLQSVVQHRARKHVQRGHCVPRALPTNRISCVPVNMEAHEHPVQQHAEEFMVQDTLF